MMSDLFIRSINVNLPPEIKSNPKYPFIPSVLALDGFEFTSPVTIFTGENGTGKSTVIEAIAVKYGFNPEGGSKNFTFSTNNTHSRLYKHITLGRGVRMPSDGFFLRAESYYNVSSEIQYLERVSKPGYMQRNFGGDPHARSHGESFMSLIENRFRGNGMYILDEPEAALSPMRCMSLISIISSLVKKHSQFIISTHSPILMAFPGADIYTLTNDGMYKCDYKQTDHYKITRYFLENPEQMIKILID